MVLQGADVVCRSNEVDIVCVSNSGMQLQALNIISVLEAYIGPD